MLNWNDLSPASQRRLYAAMSVVLLGIVILLCEPLFEGAVWAVKNRSGLSIITYAGLGGIFSGCVLLAILIAIEMRRHGASAFRAKPFTKPAEPPWPISGGVVWLGMSARVIKFQAAGAWVALVVTLVLITFAVYVNGKLPNVPNPQTGVVRLLFWVSCLAVVLFGIYTLLMFYAVRWSRRFRIGTDGAYLLLDRGKSEPQRFAFTDVMVSAEKCCLANFFLSGAINTAGQL